jgi:hypothetical protein
MKKFYRRYFQWKNLLLFATLVGAILAISGVIQTDKQNIILGLLGVLAIDAFVERVGTLADIEEKVKVLAASQSKGFLLTRSELNEEESFTKFIQQSKKDILIVGINFAQLLNDSQVDFWVKLIQNGVNVRFLMHNPNSKFISQIANYHGRDEQSVVSGFTSSLTDFDKIKREVSLLKIKPKGSLEVRYIDNELTFGGAMRDCENVETGTIRFEILLYRTMPSTRPAFKLTHSDVDDYEKFKESLENLWRIGIPRP